MCRCRLGREADGQLPVAAVHGEEQPRDFCCGGFKLKSNEAANHHMARIFTGTEINVDVKP
jgi:hypothetical protein